MPSILQLNTSLFGDSGQSSRLAADFAGTVARGTGRALRIRDLAANPLPHLTAERVTAFATPAAERTLDQQRQVAESDALVEELRDAEVIVIGLPMYNFGVPSTLKSYFDNIARAGVTFRYTAEGPVGLLTGKKVFVFATRGGQHAGTASDLQTGYVRQFLGFIGIRDVEFIYAEGLALGEPQRAEALAAAAARIQQLAA